MNKVFLWFFLSCKRALKRPFFLILLLLIPTSVWFLRTAETGGSHKISIALYTEGDSWNETVARRLMNSGSSFSYYRCDTREELIEDVMTGRAECGYVFPKDLLSKLESGSYKRAVTVVTSPSTVTSMLASEAVFAGLFEVYGKELLKGYVEEDELFKEFPARAAWQEIEPLYHSFLNDGSTFSFHYGTTEGTVQETEEKRAVFPVRGIISVFLFVMGLAAAVTAGEDEKNGLWKAVSNGRKKIYTAAQLAAPIALSAASAIISLYVSGNSRGFFIEARALFIYGALILLVSWLLLHFLKNPLLISGLIPFFIIISLVACPVFADLSVFIPALREIRYLLPPAYYLWM